ncbi:hypothetical protein O3P69_014524 [Scylla paramamosain]|uniref:Uncharacterized protein n=1 Tax=Scylla paramamosain TaxID=85552 RepID=A0AAW0TEP1_SCYPA
MLEQGEDKPGHDAPPLSHSDVCCLDTQRDKAGMSLRWIHRNKKPSLPRPVAWWPRRGGDLLQEGMSAVPQEGNPQSWC